VKNAVVTNESPQKLALAFRGYFDKILVDAPCSGEGMFRKDEDAVRSWENFKCEKCAKMQEDILTSAEKMLRPGGLLLYSTCTFSPEEDEKMISSFLENNKNYELLDLPKTGGIEDGRPDWGGGLKELSKTARLWPHKLKGEGHFTALLRKKDESSAPAFAVPLKSQRSEVPAEFYNFVRDNLNTEIEGHFDIKGNNLYCLPEAIPDLSGIKVAKFGWYLGEFVHGKFEPSHSMIISLKKEDIKNVLNLDSKSRDVLSYLKGETPAIELEKNGFAGVCVDGYTLGWAKQSGGTLKNLYPKGWRKMN
jgi:NOL1/NOP2/fmu family ribosome biogenesis protein